MPGQKLREYIAFEVFGYFYGRQIRLLLYVGEDRRDPFRVFSFDGVRRDGLLDVDYLPQGNEIPE